MSKNEVSLHILRKVVVDGLLFVALGLALYTVDVAWTPFQRGFFCGDESLMFPYKDDTITVSVLRAVGLVPALIAFIICEWAVLRNVSDDQHCFGIRLPAWIRGIYCVGASFGIGACFIELAANMAKATIGRPRPHFFDLCQPSVNCSDPFWQGRYIQPNEYTCTSEELRKLLDMRKSFPSGHSAWSSYCSIYVAMYLQQRMTWKGSKILRSCIQYVLLMVSWFIALSRVSDFKHHWSDVLSGYCMGPIAAVLMYKYGTELIQKKKEHLPVPQFEVNLPTNQLS